LLAAIIIITIVAITGDFHVKTVGPMGQLPATLPMFAVPNVPFNLETLMIILPYSFPLALAWILECLITAAIAGE
jgi:SulP family sulfate permease